MSTTETMSLEKAIELIRNFDYEAQKCTGWITRAYEKDAKALLAAILGRKPTKEEFQKLIERLG